MSHHTLDTTGLICPEPIMLLHKIMRQANSGDVIEMSATDPATCRDVPNFCRHLGHLLLNEQHQDNLYHYTIQKK
ncbi:MAG: sulfurtransferase TusA [Moraxella sp.]|nr:sulfurtransferase TusA [Moraxella sp.]